MTEEQLKQLELLREPFSENLISKLPKPTKAQTEAVRNDFKVGARCQLCGGWHHPSVVHLDYVGHAALTDRLLDVDPEWNWSPVGSEVPTLDNLGGMWIQLTICGVSRYGYGSADGKKGGDAIKEVIGDAIRNAAMRFGAALDLWHKGDLHAHKESEGAELSSQEHPQSTMPSELVSVMSEGNDINTCQYWRSLTQEAQQAQWSTLDKESQKLLKNLLKEHPPKEQAA